MVVVDESDASRAALVALLEGLGHRAAGAGDASTALAWIAADRPQLVLLSLGLPGSAALGLIERIRADANGDCVRVIVLSAPRNEAHLEEALRRGADDYLAHPVSPMLLETRMRLHARLLAREGGERIRIERMRAEFLATVSHELRTPVTSVLGALSLLAGGASGELTATGRRLVGAAQRNGRRLHQLIDGILERDGDLGPAVRNARPPVRHGRASRRLRHPRHGPGGAGTAPRILCVDDDADILLVLQLSLREIGGFETLLCGDAAGALDAARNFRPDLVLLDVMMPRMSGPQLLEKLRACESTRKVPVVFMTAMAAPTELGGLLELGAAGVIGKPFDAMRLSSDLRPFLDLAHD